MTHTEPNQKAAFNRALLSRAPIDSQALAVRGAIFHRFGKPGRYEVFVDRGGRRVHRELLEVADLKGSTQIDVRLGVPEDEARCQCGQRDAEGARLQTGGVMAFHAARGSASYRVRIERWHDKGRDVELDSHEALAAGDLFAAALVTPGLYRVRVGKKTLAEVKVRDPDPKHPHRTDMPVLLRSGEQHKGGVEIDAGICVVVWLDEPGSVRFEPVELLGEKLKAA
jgi:hypothetical protein